MKHFLFQLARKLQITKKRILVLALAPVFSLGLVAVVSAPAQADSPSPTCVEYNPDYPARTGKAYTIKNGCPHPVRTEAEFGPMNIDSGCRHLAPGEDQVGERHSWGRFEGLSEC